LPLEVLLARYGYNERDEGADADADAEADGDADEDADEEEVTSSPEEVRS